MSLSLSLRGHEKSPMGPADARRRITGLRIGKTKKSKPAKSHARRSSGRTMLLGWAAQPCCEGRAGSVVAADATSAGVPQGRLSRGVTPLSCGSGRGGLSADGRAGCKTAKKGGEGPLLRANGRPSCGASALHQHVAASATDAPAGSDLDMTLLASESCRRAMKGWAFSQHMCLSTVAATRWESAGLLKRNVPRAPSCRDIHLQPACREEKGVVEQSLPAAPPGRRAATRCRPTRHPPSCHTGPATRCCKRYCP